MAERLKAATQQAQGTPNKVPNTVADTSKLPELEMQVLAFIKSTKLIGGSIPLEGATNPEIAMAFPNANSNTLRYTVYSLRKKKLLVDKGLTRHIQKGKSGCVVWFAVEGAR